MPNAEQDTTPDTGRESEPDTPGTTSTETVRAAGAVLWRTNSAGQVDVAVVHRPRYDDWSLPKGKIDPGENAPRAAAREVTEETGFSCALSRYLTEVAYAVPKRNGDVADKRVDYFAAEARDGAFHANEEVDVLRWLPPDEARDQLTYPHDGRVLDAFERLPTDVATLLLVRHAKAGSRADFSGDDALRPLSKSGQRQREALRQLLPLYAPERVHAAPKTRCEQTVQPIADDLGVSVESEPLLSEEGYSPRPQEALQRLLTIAAGSGVSVVCSQGGVIPELVGRLVHAGGLQLSEIPGAFDIPVLGGMSAIPGSVQIPSKKASVWTLTFRRERDPNDGEAPVRLAAADYLADPLS